MSFVRPAGIAFDAFGTLFDLNALRRPLAGAVGTDRADAAFEAFASRLVPWTWHATAAGRYRPFPEIATLALEAAVSAVGGKVSGAEADELAVELTRLPAYPEVADGLARLADDGHRLAVLSNGTREGVEALVSAAGLTERFDHLLAADEVGRFKPAPEVYALAPAAFGAPGEDVLLVSAHAWDVAGARQAGLRGALLLRGAAAVPALGEEPDAVAADVADLARALARE